MKSLISILVIIVSVELIYCRVNECHENEFQCPLTGGCISKLMVCDGFIDCPGYHDEINCSFPLNRRSIADSIETCLGFLCKDSDECIPADKICNGSPDCPNGGDEFNCPTIELICLPNCQFDYNLNQTITYCLNSTSICDGQSDCFNGLDEIDCDQPIIGKRSYFNFSNQPNETTSNNYINCKQLGSFNCGGGKCIKSELVCNGQIDCPNGLDEGISCKINVTCDNRSCTQKCLPLINGSKCDCHQGYQLLADGFTCEDIDECSLGPLERPCFQECVNTLGNFRCDCFEGWTIANDGKTCNKKTKSNKCKVTMNDPYLLMVKNDVIYLNYLQCMDNAAPIANLSTHISTFTYDHEGWKIYYYSVASMSINVIDVIDKVTSRFIKLNNVTRPIKSLVFDDLSGNLYWIEPAKGSIEIISTREPDQTIITLIEDLTDATQLVLNQERGEMYIAVIGFEPKILVTSLLGKNIVEIVSSSVDTFIYPTALFLDKMDQRLYWSNSASYEIYFISLLFRKGEFGPREKIQFDGQKFNETVRSMVIHDGKMYLATKDNKLILVDIFRRDSKNDYIKLPENSKNKKILNDFDIIYGFNNRYRSPCLDDNRGGCSHICTFIDSTVTCLCPKGMTLESTGRTCIKKSLICPSDNFKCSDGTECVKISARCNGNYDCDDKSDEVNCTSIKTNCPENYEQCPIGSQCIPKIWFCDSFFDCPEGSDEKNCTHLCRPDQFSCGGETNNCIPSDWVCDQIADCANKSDETNCNN